jgi:hypothetical protein
MSDYRNRNSAYRDPLRPHRRDDPSTRGGHAGWWVAGGILLVVITPQALWTLVTSRFSRPAVPFVR